MDTASAAVVCIRNSDGAIFSRPRCKRDESAATVNSIVDTAKAKRSYLSSCRSIEATDSTTTGTAGATATCNSNEYMLNYGDYTVPITLGVMRRNEIQYAGPIPVGVTLISQVDFGVPSVPFVNTYTLHVQATCCPRL